MAREQYACRMSSYGGSSCYADHDFTDHHMVFSTPENCFTPPTCPNFEMVSPLPITNDLFQDDALPSFSSTDTSSGAESLSFLSPGNTSPQTPSSHMMAGDCAFALSCFENNRHDYPAQQSVPVYPNITDNQVSCHQPMLDQESALLQRFSLVLNSHAPISTWAQQLNDFYNAEKTRIEMDRCKDISGMEACRSHYLQPLIHNFFDGQIHSLIFRVSQSVSVLEEYAGAIQSNTISSLSTQSSSHFNSSQSQSANVSKKVYRRPPKHLNATAHTVMEQWYKEHKDNPYPDAATIRQLAQSGMVSPEQVKKWFCNKRSRNSNTRPLSEVVKLRKRAKRAKTDA